MAYKIMIQGTASNVGKSILCAGLCRIFAQDGYKVAPFKSQNMALNSAVTHDGLEMGRAQVVQAQAAGILPTTDMNPILLKPTGEMGSQVIVNGVSQGTKKALDYYAYKKELLPAVLESFSRLETEYDIIVIEGAGSPAEINLKKDDFVNMGLAKLVESPVLLCGDIDRGGVFAALYGTVQLLEKEEQDHIKGLIINKFRGDIQLLGSGLGQIEDLTKKPVLGVLPMLEIDIDDEDSLSTRFHKKENRGLVDIAVIRLPRLSNFTDFNPLERYEQVHLRYVSKATDLGNPDVLILPGTKETIDDMLWLREGGFVEKIQDFAQKGGSIVGICGGYQLLCKEIADPEGAVTQLDGLGLLPGHTSFFPEKTKRQVSGTFHHLQGKFAALNGTEITGYEIHMGQTTGNSPPILSLQRENQGIFQDGMSCGQIWGTYVHGLFDRGEFTRKFLNIFLAEKGLSLVLDSEDWDSYSQAQYDKLADGMRKSLDMDEIYRIMGIKRHPNDSVEVLIERD